MIGNNKPKVVVPFKPQENADVLKRRERPYTECRHYSFEIDEQERMAYCAQCGASLDPFWVLWRLTALFKEQDYKHDRIVRFEEEQRQKAERDRLRREGRKRERNA